jgi:hypothetical protein
VYKGLAAIAKLKQEHNLTCSFDGGSTWGGDSFYTMHATTPAQHVMLLEGWECTKESHTGQWIADFVISVRLQHSFGLFANLQSETFIRLWTLLGMSVSVLSAPTTLETLVW